jgi:hypothetical protein
MELILVVSAVGTATTMFPFLRKDNEAMALLHVCFRFLEAKIITDGVISVLSLLTLIREFAAAGAQGFIKVEKTYHKIFLLIHLSDR